MAITKSTNKSLARSRKLDIKFRKPVRTIVGPLGSFNWSAPWHDILHEWNARVLECAEMWWNVLTKLASNYGPEMPGTTSATSKLHFQPFRQPLVETCPSVDCRTQDEDWKTNTHTHGMRKYKLTADGKILENGGQQQCKQIFGWHIWISLLNFRRRSNESLNWIKFCCFPAPYEGCLRASRLDSTRLKNSVARIQTEWLGKPIVEFPWKTP